MEPVQPNDTPPALPETWRPRYERYDMLTRLWWFPSLGALVVLWENRQHLSGLAQGKWPWEVMIAFLLLGLHIDFARRRRHWRKHEKPVPLEPLDESEAAHDEPLSNP